MPVRTVEISFLGSTSQLEAALVRAGLVAKESGNTIGDAFDKGSTKAGNALTRLGTLGQSFGVPFAGHLTVIGDKFEDVDTKGQKFATTMGTLGGATLLAAGAAFAGVSVEAVRLGAAFDKSVAQIAGAAGIPIAAAKKIGDAFLATAGTSVYSGNEMAAAFAPVAGQLKLTEGHALTAAESLKFMSAAGDLAEASQTSLTGSSSALAQVMQSFHLSTAQAAQAGDLLFNTSRSLNVPITTVSGAIDKLHARLGELMPSMSDVAGLMVTLGEHGLTGARSVQIVQSSLTTLTAGSKATTAMLDELGVHVFNQNGKFVGMASLIDQLRPKLSGLTQQSQELALKTLFGSSAWQVMGQVIGAGTPAFQKATDAASKLGTAHAAAQLQAHTLGGELRTLEATLSDLGTKIGEVLIPVFQHLGMTLADGINWLEKHKTAAEALAVVISSVLGTAVLVFAEQKAVKFGQSIGNMITDMGKLVGAVETGAAKIISQFTAQGTAAEASSTTMQAAGAETAGAVQAEAAAVGTATGEIDTSLASTATSAQAATAGVDTAAAGEAAAVTAADTTIEAENTAAAASFTAMLGPIAAVVAAYELFNAQTLNAPSAEKGTQKQFNQFAGMTTAFNMPATGAQGSAGSLISYLQSQGFSKNAAAGIAGNIGGQEDPNWRGSTVEGGGTSQTPVTGKGFGLAQWTTTSRQAGLVALAAQMHLPPSDARVQYAYIAYEIKNNPSLLKQLNAAGSPAAAALIASNVYEAPLAATANNPGRESAATAYGSASGGGSSTLPTGTGTITTPGTTTKPASTSYHYNWQTGTYQQMTAAQYKALQAAWYAPANAAANGGGSVPMPTSASAAAKAGAGGTTATSPSSSSLQSANAMLAIAGEYGVGGGHQSLDATNVAIAKAQAALGTSGGSELGKLQGYATGTSLRGLTTLTTPGSQANKDFETLVESLRATHDKALQKLASQLVATYHQDETAKNNILEGDSRTLLAAMTTKISAAMHDTSVEMTQAFQDAAKAIQDEFSAAATAIGDQTQGMQDQASAQAQAISDQAQTTVDQLGERGLYGLNLLAQQQTVAADQAKTSFDAQIAAAQAAVDAAKQSGDNAGAAQTAIVDAVTAQQNVLIGSAQAHLDAVTAQQNVLVQQAQNAVDAGSAGSEAALKAAEGTAAAQEALAQQALTAAQDAAAQAEAQAQSALSNANGQASVVVAQAQQALAGAQNQAAVTEAQQQALVAITKERAQTQYAGSGVEINFYGLDPGNAAAIGQEVSWIARTQLMGANA